MSDLTQVIELDSRLTTERHLRSELIASHQQQQRMEEQLRESQKLEAIGQLTGGLAHDFNNLLGIVVGNLDRLGENLPDIPEVRLQHGTALQAALRGAEVTRTLLAVARRQPLKVQEHDINELLRSMVPLLHSTAGSAITVRCDLLDGALLARLDPSGLSNAVLNLVINARDAMQHTVGDRVITLRTCSEVVDEDRHDNLGPGTYAVLQVTDVGTGMSESLRAQAFEPFFTTKQRGQGTGLGLAMVYGYASQLGGTVVIHSLEGMGTTVSVYLPADAELPPEDAKPAPASVPLVPAVPTEGAGQGGADTPMARVLVVDDEPELCALASDWLESLGYSVATTHSPAQALDLLQQGRFDVLFTDVVMPGGMDGLELARKARKMQPDLRVLLASGYAQSLLDATELPGPLLNKPYRKKDIASAMREVLQARDAQPGPRPELDPALG
jgi:signal transduction histidine kinase/CheY-like chemotaxis protein